MGKYDKTGLGRALVKQHNHMVQLAKEKGKSQRKKVLESITEVTDIETVIENAEEADLLFDAENPNPSFPIDLDGRSSDNDLTLEEGRSQQQKEEVLHPSSIRVPRRPPWNAGMSPEELVSMKNKPSSFGVEVFQTARQMLKDYVDGKLPHFELPPGMSYEEESNETTSEPDSSDVESSLVDVDASAPVLENVLSDLNSFDIVNDIAPEKAKFKKAAPTASHKQHKKPQRKKDRTWRAANYDGDGMPVVRAFHKPVNTGPV